MKKKLVMGIGVSALICSIGLSPTFAASSQALGNDSQTAAKMQMGAPRGGMTGDMTAIRPGGRTGEMPAHMELTDEQKAEMEAAKAEREEKLNEFLATLSEEQLALYEAASPTPSEDGTAREKPDESAMTEMKEKREAFLASLSDEQSAAYEALSGKRSGRSEDLTDEQKAEMEATRAEHKEKIAAFLSGLNEEQLALYEASYPASSEPSSPEEGKTPEKPDESAITEMQKNKEAFLASLSDEQLAVYEELIGNAGRRAKRAQPGSTEVQQ